MNVTLKLVLFSNRLSQAEYHEQEEIFKLRLGYLKKVKLPVFMASFWCFCASLWPFSSIFDASSTSDLMLFAGGGRDPGRTGEIGASPKPSHTRAEKDPQRR